MLGNEGGSENDRSEFEGPRTNVNGILKKEGELLIKFQIFGPHSRILNARLHFLLLYLLTVSCLRVEALTERLISHCHLTRG